MILDSFLCSYKHQPIDEHTWALGKIETKCIPGHDAELVSQHYGKEIIAVPIV